MTWFLISMRKSTGVLKMNNNSFEENYTSAGKEFEESFAEVLSLEIQRDSRRYRTDLSVGGD